MTVGDGLQQPPVDELGGRPIAGVQCVVSHRGRLDETMDLLRGPMHVDREGHTAVQHDREPELAGAAAVALVGAGQWIQLALHCETTLAHPIFPGKAAQLRVSMNAENGRVTAHRRSLERCGCPPRRGAGQHPKGRKLLILGAGSRRA